jgi:Double zinc ribbon
MGALAVFGIENDGLNLAVNLLLLFLVVLWLALVYWTYADARRRIEDPMLIGCATAASLFPFIGTIVYVIVRPPEYLEDMRERELEIAAAEARLASIDQLGCPYCGFEIEKSFLRCPSCLRRLKEPCTVCGKPLDPRWKICPYCEAEVGQAAPEGRRPRERRRTAAARAPATQPRPAQPPGNVPRAAEQGAERPVAADRPRTERPPRATPTEGRRPQSAG